jgi:hypothetical protein
MAQSGLESGECFDMTTRTRGPFAGFGWLWAGVQTLGRRPGVLYGAAACVLGLSLLPSLLSFGMQYAYPQSVAVSVGVMVISLLVGLALGPAQGGFMQVVDAVKHGRPARARDVFAPYRDSTLKWRLVGFAAVVMVISLAMVLVVFVAMGFHPWSADWQAAMAGQMASGQPKALPPGFWKIITAVGLLSPLLMSLLAIGYGQIALAGRSIGTAVSDGVIGGLRNVHVLWILVIGGVLMGVVLAIVLGIGVGIIGFLAALLGKAAMFAVIGVFYIALMLTMNVVMFGFMHALWRDVCDVADGDVPSAEVPGDALQA